MPDEAPKEGGEKKPKPPPPSPELCGRDEVQQREATAERINDGKEEATE